jgi:putative copper export protein
VGFRYAAVRARLTRTDPSAPDDRTIYADAARRAAIVGLFGAVVETVLFIVSLPGTAAAAHTTVVQLLATDIQTSARFVLLLVAIVGFWLAAQRGVFGWRLAAVGMIGEPFVAALAGRWSHLINPLHRFVAGLWIGTLFVLVIAGLVTVLRASTPRDRRGAIAAAMINGFSPLALTCGGVLVASGLVTAWQHLKRLSSLWTTPYGYALIVKLCIVAVVFGLGAWNWRRQRPRLGTEGAAAEIRRSSVFELTAATLVLIVTAILVSLPAPKA